MNFKITNKLIIIPIIIISLLLILIAFFFCIKKDDSFRNISIGMTKEKVFEIEKTKNNCENIKSLYGVYSLKGAVYDGYKGDIIYEFDNNNKLSVICLTIENATKNDYNDIKETFINRYEDIIDEDTERFDGSIITNLKYNNTKYTISYQTDNNIVIYIQMLEKGD